MDVCGSLGGGAGGGGGDGVVVAVCVWTGGKAIPPIIDKMGVWAGVLRRVRQCVLGWWCLGAGTGPHTFFPLLLARGCHPQRRPLHPLLFFLRTHSYRPTPHPTHPQVDAIRSDAMFILLVEKDAAFMRLAEDRFYNTYPCIIITAKGQPDVATRWVGGWVGGAPGEPAFRVNGSAGLPHTCPPTSPLCSQALSAQAQADAAHPGPGAGGLRPVRPQDPVGLHEGCAAKRLLLRRRWRRHPCCCCRPPSSFSLLSNTRIPPSKQAP